MRRSIVSQARRIQQTDRLSSNVEEFGQTPGDGFPWTKVGFGRAISGNTVTIYPGEVQYRTDEPVSTIESDRTFSTNGDFYIAVEYTYLTKSAVIGSLASTKPCSSADVFRKWLYQFRKTDDGVELLYTGWFLNIHIE
jgi:hypothetical protein